jgi:hypothetical protein
MIVMLHLIYDRDPSNGRFTGRIKGEWERIGWVKDRQGEDAGHR